MAWDNIHKIIGSNSQVTMTPGYYSETITLGNNADSSTSILSFPVKSDFTILAKLSADLAADTYIQVEHSLNGATWFKHGEFEEDLGVDHDDISKNMSKIAAIDISLMVESEGLMMMYAVDSHGMSPNTRFTVKANGQNESAKTCAFYIIPHF
tara:strand:+ start:1254 stop:1712 length:459 start_codon:yes stop_codon:yes gene_type:complete